MEHSPLALVFASQCSMFDVRNCYGCWYCFFLRSVLFTNCCVLLYFAVLLYYYYMYLFAYLNLQCCSACWAEIPRRTKFWKSRANRWAPCRLWRGMMQWFCSRRPTTAAISAPSTRLCCSDPPPIQTPLPSVSTVRPSSRRRKRSSIPLCSVCLSLWALSRKYVTSIMASETIILIISRLQYYNVNGLQKVCDALSDNPSWTLAHLVAYFNLVEYISNPKVLQCIDVADHTTLMSPFQLAIKQGHIEMVKLLLPLSKIEHLDINSNSVFHYAASTSKEIINVSDSRRLG